MEKPKGERSGGSALLLPSNTKDERTKSVEIHYSNTPNFRVLVYDLYEKTITKNHAFVSYFFSHHFLYSLSLKWLSTFKATFLRMYELFREPITYQCRYHEGRLLLCILDVYSRVPLQMCIYMRGREMHFKDGV